MTTWSVSSNIVRLLQILQTYYISRHISRHISPWMFVTSRFVTPQYNCSLLTCSWERSSTFQKYFHFNLQFIWAKIIMNFLPYSFCLEITSCKALILTLSVCDTVEAVRSDYWLYHGTSTEHISVILPAPHTCRGSVCLAHEKHSLKR